MSRLTIACPLCGAPADLNAKTKWLSCSICKRTSYFNVCRACGAPSVTDREVLGTKCGHCSKSRVSHAAVSDFHDALERLSPMRPSDLDDHDRRELLFVYGGGSGMRFRAGGPVILRLSSSGFELASEDEEVAFRYGEIRTLSIEGPGRVSTSLGLMGGGFGLEGALKGMLMSTAINILTTRTTTETHLRIMTDSCEVLLVNPVFDTGELRRILSPMFVKYESVATQPAADAPPIVEGLSRLAELHSAGVLTDAEFQMLKAQLLKASSPGE